MPFCDISQRLPKELLSGVATRTFWGENMLLGLVDLQPHAVIPAHAHPHEQSSFIITGELEMTLGDEAPRHLQAGDLVIIPGGVSHRVVVGPQACRVLDIFAPAREDMKY